MMASFKQVISQLSNGEFWGVFILVSGITVFCWYLWYRKAKRARLIEDVPTSKIRSAPQGFNEIIGHAEFIQNDVIRSPLSGRECVWYRYRVQERKRDSKGNTRWETVEKSTSDDIFVLEDDTGQCIVDPSGAEVITYEKQSWSGQNRRPGLLVDQSSGMLNMHTYRYEEEWIEPGEILYAIGNFETEGTGEDLPQLRDEVREVLKHWKTNPQYFLQQFDKNKDGKIDQEEWEAVKVAAEKKVLEDRVNNVNVGVAHIMSKPHDHPYILSSLNLEELVQHYRWRSRLSIICAVLTGAVAVIMLSVRF